MELNGIPLYVTLGEDHNQLDPESISFRTEEHVVPRYDKLEVWANITTVYQRRGTVITAEEAMGILNQYTPIAPSGPRGDFGRLVEAVENDRLVPRFWIRVWGEVEAEPYLGDVIYDNAQPPRVKRLAPWAFCVRPTKIDLEPEIKGTPEDPDSSS